METHKWIEPTKKHEGEMIEVRDYNAERWEQRKLLAVLPKPQVKRFICEVRNDQESSRGWYQARISVPKTYKERQAECGLKIGDYVKVIRSFSTGEAGFNAGFVWHEGMDKAIGNVYPIAYIQADAIGLHINDNGIASGFPYFVLEKVKKPAHEFMQPAPPGEIVHVPGAVEHWIYKGHAYRLATARDLGKDVYCSDTDFKTSIRYHAKELRGFDPRSSLPYETNKDWLFAYIQDDSLLKPEQPKEEYEPYTWEDRHEIRDLWYRWKANGCESAIGKLSQDSKGGELLIDYIYASCLFKNATHLDKDGKDTGIPFGKKKV